MNMPLRKRVFDLLLTTATIPIWLPLMLLVSVALALLEGRPIFYRSLRRVGGQGLAQTWKFRTMVRNAAALYNRDTVPVNGQRFLNTPPDSPLYTRTGRLIERCQMTEMPQIFLVYKGTMSIIGNRPLPENVVQSLAQVHSNVEARFDSPCGLTGPTQLVGREALTDGDRLNIEGRYSAVAMSHYSMRMDLMILVYTVLIHGRLMRPLDVDSVYRFLERFTTARPRGPEPPTGGHSVSGFGHAGERRRP